MAGPSRASASGEGSAASDMLVHSRARRSTAGNRMKALLDQELERDEMFEEVENDIDFEAQDEQDIIDSDFDRDSSDGQGGGGSDDDEDAGERRLEELERAQRKAKRAKAVPIHARKPAIRAPPPKPAMSRKPAETDPQEEDEIEEESGRRSSKRRRIAFAPTTVDSLSPSVADPSETGSPGPGMRSSLRTSSRSATVQNKLEVEEKLREAEKRRAALPVRHAPKRKPQLTQDALIAEALEVEETNRESLKRFLQQEEARRAKDRVRKERIEGPFIRWVSRGVRPLIQPISTNKEGNEDQGKERTDEDRSKQVEATDRQLERMEEGDRTPRKVSEGSTKDDAPASAHSGQPGGAPTTQRAAGSSDVNSHPMTAIAGESAGTLAGNTADGSALLAADAEMRTTAEPSTPPPLASASAEALEPQTPPGAPPSNAMAPAPTIAASAQPQPPREPPAPEGDRAGAAPPATSTTDLTEDPVVAARAEAARLKAQQDAATKSAQQQTPNTNTDAADGPDGRGTTSDTGASAKWGPLQTRTFLSVERTPEDWDWEDDFRVLLGDHCSWSTVPIVPARNRPLRPRQSICPITGLPALYRDPRTGIPYATAKAYGIISEVLKSRFVWTGRGEKAEDDEDADADADDEEVRKKAKRKSKKGDAPSAPVGRCAAPIEMGCYMQAEDEPGAAGVFSGLVAGSSSAEGGAATGVTQRDDGILSYTKAGGSSAATAATPAAKPRYEMAWTAAVAPGDEEAIMAAAAQLPAGSTRSGRRGARKP